MFSNFTLTTALVSLKKKAHIYEKHCNRRKTNSNYAENASSIIESTKCYHFPYPPSLLITFGTLLVTIETIGKDHSSYGKALFQYFRKDLGIPAGTAYTESDFCNYINTKIDCLLGCATDTGRLGEQIHQSLLGYSTAMTTRAIVETLRIIDTDIKYYMAQRFPQVQQPVESDPKEYENKSNKPVTAQAKSTVNKKPRVLSLTTSSYHQTPQSRIVFNPPPETQLETPRTPGNPHSWNQHSWTKLLEEYGLLFGNLNPAAGQTEGNPSTWEQPPAQNLAESASPLMKETAILQPIGLSDKGKQPALAPGKHLNTQTPIPLNITSNTPPINWIMAYQDITKLEKFFGEEDNAYSWIVDAEKAITTNSWNDNRTVQALPFFLIRTANSWYQSLAEKPTSFTEFKLAFLQYFCIKRDYTMAQVLNQFIKGLQSSILRSVRPYHLTSLQDAITLAHDFESAEQEANHTQAVNLAINRTSDIDAKITQLTDTHSNRTISNSNNLEDPISTTATTAKNLNTSSVTAEGRSWTKIKETHTSNPDISKTWYPNIPYLRINRPYMHNSNIPPATITEDTTLAAIFSFNIDNLNTHSLFSGAAINQDKPITALYTNARVGRIDIKLILDSRSAGSIITKQLMDQLGCQVDRAATAWIITADGNTKTPIGEIDNFPFKINRIQIPTKVLVIKATQYQALVENDWLSKANTTLDWNTQELQLTFNRQYVRVPAICEHFKNQHTEEPLIEFEDTSMPPTIETYQGTSIEDAWKRALNRLDGYPHNDHKIWRMASTKAEGAMHEEIREIKDNPWMPEYTGPDYPKNNFFTDDPNTFQNQYQKLAPTRKEQEQRLADLNTKLCNYCLILCHFQYCDGCDLMFNPPPRILFPITELPELEEEVLITEDMSFQDPTEDTKTKQYFVYPNLSKELELKWYSDNEEGICPERVHDTNATPHSFVKIDLKIVLEIPVSTMVQKKINIKGRIINAGYMGNIIMMLQNNSDRLYKIELQEKIAQAIFLPLVKILQLTPASLPEESTGLDQVEEETYQLISQRKTVTSLKICSLANVVNLYLLAKAHKHFKILIHNPTEDVIEIPKGTLVGSISADSQNPEKPQSIPDFAQLFLFCDITLQVWNLPKESYLFAPEEINKLNLGNLSTLQQMQLKVLLNQYANVFVSENEFGCTDIVKHQIDTGDTRPIKQ
ncbi:hypothetical protein G9A89_007819 [Geosiphon pyriformis]|nr:hypothetical protein G9A89_007819 [Geosiphon pyriformis]